MQTPYTLARVSHQTPLIMLAALILAVAAVAKERAPGGLLAASVGDQVILAEPGGAVLAQLGTGPVGWLFPAPGGVLFAPDLVNGRTSIVDLRLAKVRERVDGVTMPRFGTSVDRYLAVSDGVLMLSYPERATLFRVNAEIANPWQVIVMPYESAVLVLDRVPDAGNGVHLVAIDLTTRRQVYRAPLEGDVVRMTFASQLGLLALVDRESTRVDLVDPGTMLPHGALPTSNGAVDVAFFDKDRQIVIAEKNGDGGALAIWKLHREGETLRRKHQRSVALGAAPYRLAVDPTGTYLAAALSSGSVVIVDSKHWSPVSAIELGEQPRDLVWCDPAGRGPMLPEWSDQSPPQLSLEKPRR